MCEVFYPYTWFFTNFAVYLTYGGGMPLMYLLGFIFFLVSYICYKWLFVDFYRKSYGFDEKIPVYSVKLMKYALFAHLAMNLFMFTNKHLLTPSDYDTDMHYRPSMEPTGQFLRKRFDTPSAKIVLYFTLGISVFYVFYKCIVLTCMSIF